MYAIARTGTDHHPRGSGRPYGEQFTRVSDAFHALQSYERLGPVKLIVLAEVDVATDLYARVKGENKRHVATRVRKKLPSFYKKGSSENLVVGPFPVADADAAVRTWWETWGRFDSSPWDPNGIVTARRLGLVRGEDSEHFSWDEDGEDVDVLIFDDYCFKAFNNGQYALRPWREIWNEAAKTADMGWHW